MKDFTLRANSIDPSTQPKPPTKTEIMAKVLEPWEEADLLDLRHYIDTRLHLDIADINLVDEISVQFRQAKAMMDQVQKDNTIPTNQKAQLFNSLRSQLDQIFKQQVAIWSMGRLRDIETATVKACKLMTAEQKEAFMSVYGRYLKEEVGE